MQDNNNRQQETRKWLYESLSGNGYDLGSYEDFDKHADEKETREWLYNAGKESGLELGSYWKSHATLTLLAKQDCPLWLQYDCPFWPK